ncbi:MAG: TonB-dependent receptor [Sphingobacteriales bacterium]|nr:MAG: TonB-dependent receptor [Sphingobacteriales bacterium]TAF81966.1 MAG: TonB-dependent receptor [Sphingobacteriales bacterium]
MFTKNKINVLFFLAILFNATTLFAQVKKIETKPLADTSKTVTQEIEVVRAYKPILSEAVKIRRNPNLSDIKIAKPKINYNILDKRLELNTNIKEIEIQKLLKLSEQALKNNFAKIALGNFGTTLAQLNLATGQDEALQAGFNFNHLAQKGKLNQQNTSQQLANVYGKYTGDKLVLSGNLQYNRRTHYFYGVDELQTFSNLHPQLQKINLFEANAEVYKRILSNNSNQLAFTSKINAYHLNNIFNGTENNVTLSAGASKNAQKFQGGANIVVDITNTKDVNYQLGNHLVKLNPYIKLDGDRFKLTAGINYVNEFGTSQRIHLFPNASINYVLIADYVTLFGQLNGDVYKTRLKDLVAQNPFLNVNPRIKNTIEKLNISGGVRGTIIPNVGFKAMVKSLSVSNFQYFINNIDEKQKFDIAYDDANILNFTGEINAKFSNNFSLDTKADFNQYNLKTQQYAWFNPALKLSTTAGVKVTQKFKLEADFYYQSFTKALVLNYPDPLAFSAPGYTPNVVNTLPSFFDISFGVNYAHSKKFTAFAKANNILNNTYQRFLYYPGFGLNVLAGLSYSF